MLEFPGGQAALMAHLGKEIKYSKESLEAGSRGIVYISFVQAWENGDWVSRVSG